MNIRELEKREINELLLTYTPKNFVFDAVGISNGTNKISLISIEIEGFSGFEKVTKVDFFSLNGIVALQGKNGYGKSSLWKAIEQCLCHEPKMFNKNLHTSKHKIELKYRDSFGEHILVCTPIEKTLDGRIVAKQIIENVRLNLEIAKWTSSARSSDFKDYSAKVLNLTNLENYFCLVELRQKELEAEITATGKKISEYDSALVKYNLDLESYQQRIALAKEDSISFQQRFKEWGILVAQIKKSNCDSEKEYDAALKSYNSQLERTKEAFAKYFAEANSKIAEQKNKLAELEGTGGGSEKELNSIAKEYKEKISTELLQKRKELNDIEEVRAAALDNHLSTIFTEKEREIIAADYVNGKKRIETKLKNAKKLIVGDCPTCTRELTAEMIADLILKYETNVAEMEKDSKMQSSLKGKEKREKDKYIWSRDDELLQVQNTVKTYEDAIALKDTEFRKKYSSITSIELVDKLLEIYGQIFNIKSLRTKNAGEIKALNASILQLEKDLVTEDSYIKKNATQSAPQKPILQTIPEQPKAISLAEIVEPKKPIEPQGYSAISEKLSENNLCKEAFKKKTSVISGITKKYFDMLKPKIEEIAKKMHLDLTVEISKNMAIGYTYNGVKMESFSSGEQTAVNIAVSLAYSYLESDILFIDEELDSLDKDNFSVVQKILKAAISELNIRSFVIISHRDFESLDGRISLC